MRNLRKLVRHRANLVRIRVVVKIKAYLLREGTTGSHIFSEIGKKKILSGPVGEIKSYVPVLNVLDKQVKESEAKIKNIARIQAHYYKIKKGWRIARISTIHANDCLCNAYQHATLRSLRATPAY